MRFFETNLYFIMIAVYYVQRKIAVFCLWIFLGVGKLQNCNAKSKFAVETRFLNKGKH